MDQLFKECVEMHAKLNRCANNVAIYQRLLFVIMFFVNTLTLGVTGLLVLKAAEFQLKEILFMFVSMEIMALNLLFNLVADLICTQGEAVVEACYVSDWTETSQRFKKSMLTIMCRANKPLEFKPPGLEALSLKNFGEVMKIAYNLAFSIGSLLNKESSHLG